MIVATNSHPGIPQMSTARLRLALDVLRARKNLMLAPPATPALARLALVGELGRARAALLNHTSE